MAGGAGTIGPRRHRDALGRADQRRRLEREPRGDFVCQRKVEMSGFPPDRIVRFHGLLQGCSAGTWYWGCFGFWVSVFVPQVLETVGRKDLRNAAPVRGRRAGADSALGSATSSFRPSAVRFRPPLHEAPHILLPAVLPSDSRPSL